MSDFSLPDWLPPEHARAEAEGGILSIWGQLPATRTHKYREFHLYQLPAMERPLLKVRLGSSETRINETKVYGLEESESPGSAREFYLHKIGTDRMYCVRLGFIARCDCYSGHYKMHCVHADAIVAVVNYLAKLGKRSYKDDQKTANIPIGMLANK